jgi:hypothetical protein
MTLNGSSTGVSEQQFDSIGEISVFIKMTESSREIHKIISVMKSSIDNLGYDSALVKFEEITEATRTGTQRTCRAFYKISRLPD